MDGQHLVDDQICREIERFLVYEARLLDNRKYQEWLDLKTEDIVYSIPVRVTKYSNGGDEFHGLMTHVDDNRHILEMRIKRLYTDAAYAEDPPSRTRHFISNFEIKKGEKENEYEVNTYVLLYRSRGSTPDYSILTGERKDVLRKEDGKWKVARRVVLLDQSTLNISNLSVFF